MKFSRTFAMPNAATFEIKPIGEFVRSYLDQSKVSVDLFARNGGWATYTNDINPNTVAMYHEDAENFVGIMRHMEAWPDLALFDPPYSPRQIAEHYREAGVAITRESTQNGHLSKRVRDALDEIMAPRGIVLSFGWNSVGMGKERGYDQIELLLVAHGGAHNDTICLAEQKR